MLLRYRRKVIFQYDTSTDRNWGTFGDLAQSLTRYNPPRYPSIDSNNGDLSSDY